MLERLSIATKNGSILNRLRLERLHSRNHKSVSSVMHNGLPVVLGLTTVSILRLTNHSVTDANWWVRRQKTHYSTVAVLHALVLTPAVRQFLCAFHRGCVIEVFAAVELAALLGIRINSCRLQWRLFTITMGNMNVISRVREKRWITYNLGFHLFWTFWPKSPILPFSPENHIFLLFWTKFHLFMM